MACLRRLRVVAVCGVEAEAMLMASTAARAAFFPSGELLPPPLLLLLLYLACCSRAHRRFDAFATLAQWMDSFPVSSRACGEVERRDRSNDADADDASPWSGDEESRSCIAPTQERKAARAASLCSEIDVF